jgi:hypothetical protein
MGRSGNRTGSRGTRKTMLRRGGSRMGSLDKRRTDEGEEEEKINTKARLGYAKDVRRNAMKKKSSNPTTKQGQSMMPLLSSRQILYETTRMAGKRWVPASLEVE